jgi:Cu/Ag efflux protein CusF
MMLAPAAATVKVAGLAMLMVAASSFTQVHGRVVAIDARRGTIVIQHEPFPVVPMPATLVLRPVRRGDLIRVRVGQTIDATVDTSIQPWPATNIRPAPARLPSPPPRRRMGG